MVFCLCNGLLSFHHCFPMDVFFMIFFLVVVFKFHCCWAPHCFLDVFFDLVASCLVVVLILLLLATTIAILLKICHWPFCWSLCLQVCHHWYFDLWCFSNDLVVGHRVVFILLLLNTTIVFLMFFLCFQC